MALSFKIYSPTVGGSEDSFHRGCEESVGDGDPPSLQGSVIVLLCRPDLPGNWSH